MNDDSTVRIALLLVLVALASFAISACTPVSHKASRFKYGDPYSPDPAEPRHEKY